MDMRMRFLRIHLVACWLCFLCGDGVVISQQPEKTAWPQAAGPHGNWIVENQQAPIRWSVTRGENVAWRTTLPEGGQSTVVVWEDRLFVTTNAPWPKNATKKASGRDVVGYCLDAYSGKILWSVKLPGIRDMKYAGIFSDSTSPSPLTDGEHVWFFNASGYMGCWDFDGNEVWTRAWQPRQRHHSRQFEPYLVGNTLLNVEVLDKRAARNTAMHKDLPEGVDPKRLWTYLHGIDKRTGEIKWIAQAGTAIHNTPAVGVTAAGVPAVLHGRGGGHSPPEQPYGWSLTSLEAGKEGQTLWDFAIPGAGSHATSQWNREVACWFHGPEHFVVDVTKGAILRRDNIEEDAIVTRFDGEQGRYVTASRQSLQLSRRGERSTRITNQANLLYGKYHYFMSWKGYFIGRVHTESGKVEYLQVPVLVDRRPGRAVDGGHRVWGKAPINDTRNSRGVDIGAVDKRSKGDGWGHVSAASPVVIGRRIYFTTMLGMVYVLNTAAPEWNEKALLAVNDMGPATQTWTLASLTSAHDRIYHRTMKEVICIGKPFGKGDRR